MELAPPISVRAKARPWLVSDRLVGHLFRTSILHRAALAIGIVPGKSLFQQVRGVTTSLQRTRKVVPKPVPVNWMGTVFNNRAGALPRCETAQISQAHLSDNKVYVVLVVIDMADHRHDAADITVLGQRLGYEDRVGCVAGKISRTPNAVHHVGTIDVGGVNVPINVALQRRVDADQSQAADHFRVVTDLLRTQNQAAFVLIDDWHNFVVLGLRYRD